MEISIHALREEGDDLGSVVSAAIIAISIHALREEGDSFVIERGKGGLKFLSTPSARRATRYNNRMPRRAGDFYPRPPRGGRPVHPQQPLWAREISIHALREEGDGLNAFRITAASYFYPRPPRGGRQVIDQTTGEVKEFLSTPSARRATALECFNGSRKIISIHALREEGDSKNGEKHLRFCFIIKRSAQIWKSFSKNIRKKSRDLHRMP